ncbi:hypothetical protein DUI87_26750 [Hirundo rustica rustica]|uniref:Uncharacterized protein n=1 Tax=Hirundo rustica rustica TaxID=333673 RepID=A0A3M0J722_HIRRU|nr:hypothetical protein DUI87_26750 [Hirundo rustica rustica]
MEEVTGSVSSLEMRKSNEAVERLFRSVTFLTPLALNQAMSLVCSLCSEFRAAAMNRIHSKSGGARQTDCSQDVPKTPWLPGFSEHAVNFEANILCSSQGIWKLTL